MEEHGAEWTGSSEAKCPQQLPACSHPFTAWHDLPWSATPQEQSSQAAA